MKTTLISLASCAIMFMAFGQDSTKTDGIMTELPAAGQYEDCKVTYDARKGESQGSGTNTITINSSRGTWTITYRFGNGNYLMKGGGNLEGKSINVRFDNGKPASLKSSHGSGDCSVDSATKN